MTKRSLRVIIVDDHPMLREGTARALAAQPDIEVVATAGQGAECLGLVGEHRPDVLVLDLHLPDMSGLEVARQVRARFPETAILVITGYDYMGYQRELSQLGVSDILSKEAAGPEIAAAIRAVAAGQPVPSSGPHPGAAYRLTARESEVIFLLWEGRRNPEIAESLCVALKTVEFHVGNILAKLGARSRMEAILKAQQEGLVPVGPSKASLVPPFSSAPAAE